MTTSCATAIQPAYLTGQGTDGNSLRPGGLALTARAITLCQLVPPARVLDVGCGSGVSAHCIHTELGLEVVALDISHSACLGASTQDTRAVVQASAASLPFPSSSMDAVLIECSLSLMNDSRHVLGECFRVLRTPGRLAITDLYARNPQAVEQLRTLPRSCASGIIVRSELEAALAHSGFFVQLWEDHSGALKELVFRFVMEHGNPEQLWSSPSTEGNGSNESEKHSRALKNVRPGYFLLVAAKRHENTVEREVTRHG